MRLCSQMLLVYETLSYECLLLVRLCSQMLLVYEALSYECQLLVRLCSQMLAPQCLYALRMR